MTQRKALPVVLAGALALPLLAAMSTRAGVASPTTESVRLPVIGDAYVSASKPTFNYGTRSTLKTGESGGYESFVKVDSRGLNGKVITATLKIYNLTDSSGFVVSRVDDSSWAEKSITYETAPVIGGMVSSTGDVLAGTWSSLDVTTMLWGDGVVSFALTARIKRDGGGGRGNGSGGSGKNRGGNYSSREGTQPPELTVVTDGEPLPTPSPSPSPSFDPGSAAECLARPSIDILPANPTTQWKRGDVPDDHTFDMRAMVNTVYPSGSNIPVYTGTTNAGRNSCYVGGVFLGQLDRGLSWQEVKDIGGAAVRTYQNGDAQVDGFQVDNIEDGFQFQSRDEADPSSGNNFRFRNSWMTYIRDDCIEDDDLASGTVYDVLFDGCFVVFSAKHDGSQPPQTKETITLDHVLARQTELPFPPQGGTEGHGETLKWDSYGPMVLIKDSIFVVDGKKPTWAPNTTFQNVTVVWTYDGSPPPTYPGLTVTQDISVWNAAREDWLDRHGCITFGLCFRLTDPIPPR
jgi:hypothetical protein